MINDESQKIDAVDDALSAMGKADAALNGRPNVGMTFLLLGGAAGFMLIFFAICQLLGVSMPAFGLLFLVYWAAILKQDLSVFLPAIFGGLTGIFLGWVMVTVPSAIGNGGLALSLATIAVVLFCFLRGHATLIINNATMLFLTVATIAQIGVARNALMMASSLIVGAVYMGGTTIAVNLVIKMRARRDSRFKS